MRRRVLLARVRAIVWALLLAPALYWWPESVAFVIVCSVYANAESAWSAAEAADDRSVLDRLDRIEALLRAAQNRPQTAGTDRTGVTATDTAR